MDAHRPATRGSGNPSGPGVRRQYRQRMSGTVIFSTSPRRASLFSSRSSSAWPTRSGLGGVPGMRSASAGPGCLVLSLASSSVVEIGRHPSPSRMARMLAGHSSSDGGLSKAYRTGRRVNLLGVAWPTPGADSAGYSVLAGSMPVMDTEPGTGELAGAGCWWACWARWKWCRRGAAGRGGAADAAGFGGDAGGYGGPGGA